MAQYLGVMLPEGKVLLDMTPVENQIPSSSQSIAVELTDGTHISADRCSRWLDVKQGKFIYQVEL